MASDTDSSPRPLLSNGVEKKQSKLRASAAAFESKISADNWRVAEKCANDVIRCARPTIASDESRCSIIRYVHRLIHECLRLPVILYGSVPLKTYLPDGDIDLTVICASNSEDELANQLYLFLQSEEKNRAAEFEVKDAQIIHAEVKLVKCLVQNVVVDISFNQIGGISTLCFLEIVDLVIRSDHLFKRSVILIKAWCYYESHILGAYNGLISTYALETLVVYILHFFYSSLDGPLAVLYKFLEYFSKFDWDNYGISLQGPVSLSSLPELVVAMPEADANNFLLTKEFMNMCSESFKVPIKGDKQKFQRKKLNIVDLLKENNNLGRSVNEGNFHRIRSAFAYGASSLEQILLLPQELISGELNKFFTNTLERSGSAEKSDDRDSLSCAGYHFKVDLNGHANMSSKTSHRASCNETNIVKIPPLDSEPSNSYQDVDVLHGCTNSNAYAYYGRSVVNEVQDISVNQMSASITLTETNEPLRVYDVPDGCYQNGNLRVTHPAGRKERSTLHFLPEKYGGPFSKPRSYPFELPDSSMSWLPGYDSMLLRSRGGEDGLVDLAGNYYIHYKSLFYAHCYQSLFSGQPYHHMYQPINPYVQSRMPTDFQQTMSSFLNVNINQLRRLSICPTPSELHLLYSAVNPMAATKKSSGTGTFFPDRNKKSYKQKSSPKRKARVVCSSESSPATVRVVNNMDSTKRERSEPDPLPQTPLSRNVSNKMKLIENINQSSVSFQQSTITCDAPTVVNHVLDVVVNRFVQEQLICRRNDNSIRQSNSDANAVDTANSCQPETIFPSMSNSSYKEHSPNRENKVADVGKTPTPLTDNADYVRPKTMNKLKQDSIKEVTVSHQLPQTPEAVCSANNPAQEFKIDYSSFASVTLGLQAKKSQGPTEASPNNERTLRLKDENDFPPLTRVPPRYDLNFPPLAKPKRPK